jgi:hypothetical protein
MGLSLWLGMGFVAVSFLILHVDDGAIYAVEGLVNGVVTVLVSVLVTRNVVGLLPWECVGDH